MQVMQQYLQVVKDYCSEENKTNDDKPVTNDELAMALGQIIRENLCGAYLHQLTDYSLQLLLLPHNECSASIAHELGCELCKCIINSYTKLNDMDRNEQFISKISLTIHNVLKELLEILLTSNNLMSPNDQSKLAQIIDLIYYLFNDNTLENINIILLKSNSFRSIASLLYENVIFKIQEINEKVQQDIITQTFHDKLKDSSIKIIRKCFISTKKLINNNILTNENKMEIINDLLHLTEIRGEPCSPHTNP
eukprot:30972_1